MTYFTRLLFLFSLCLLSTSADLYSNVSQAAASRQVGEWQHQYNKYISKELKHRTSGCTLDKLQYRREWYVPHKDKLIRY